MLGGSVVPTLGEFMKNNHGVFELRLDLTMNLGNYESKKIGVSCKVEEDKHFMDLVAELEAEMRGMKSVSTTKKEVDKVNKSGVSDEKLAEINKKLQGSEPIKEVDTTKGAAPSKEETKKETAPAKEVSKKPTAKAVKLTPYDRNNVIHKKLMGEYLDANFKGWSENANIAKATKASASMAGKDFLDSEGNIVESFKESFSAFMK